jgi:hypothetical protein
MLAEARERFRDAGRPWDPGRPGVDRLPDYGRGLLDAYAAALHVLWTYQEAWSDEAFLGTARRPESGQRLLELVGLRPDAGAAATGLQAVRCAQGRDGTVPPGFAVRSPAAAGRPAQTYEVLRARRVSWRLNELRPFLPPPPVPQPRPGAVSAVASPAPGRNGSGPSPFPASSVADALTERLLAARAGTLADRQAAQARQSALRLADLAREMAPEVAGAGCEAFEAVCRRLTETAAQAAAASSQPGPLSQSQETLVALLARLATRDAPALDALDSVLARCDGEDDAAHSRRLDDAASFLDSLVAGMLQHARDQVVLLHGSDALRRVDAAAAERFGTSSGVAAPGTDALYLLPDDVAGGAATHVDLIGPGDWLVLGEDAPAPGSPPAGAGAPPPSRVYREALQVVRVRDEVPPGQSRPMTLVTFRPPLRRRYRLSEAVLLGNVLEVSHGATVSEEGTWPRTGEPFLPLARGPLTWLRDPSPRSLDGRIPEVALAAAGRDWERVDDLAGSPPGRPAFTVETQPGQQVRLRTGDGVEGASPAPGQPYLLRYRVGVGTEGDQDAGAVRDLASAHPAVLDTVNPLPIGGGADPEPLEAARAKAREGLHALQRAVSAADVASLARTFGGVGQATVAAGPTGPRRSVRVAVCAAGGAELDDEERAALRSFLTARTPPGARLTVANRVLVPVRARLRLAVPPGQDPLAVLREVRVRLGAQRDDAVPPGLLDPAAAVLGRDLDASDLYAALDGVPHLAGAVVDLLYRDGEAPRRRDRIAVDAAGLVVWASGAGGPDTPTAEPLELAWTEAGDL